MCIMRLVMEKNCLQLEAEHICTNMQITNVNALF